MLRVRAGVGWVLRVHWLLLLRRRRRLLVLGSVESLQSAVSLLLVLPAAVSRESDQQRLGGAWQHHPLSLFERASCIVLVGVAREADAAALSAVGICEHSGRDEAAERLVQSVELLLGERERQIDHVHVQRVGAVGSHGQTLHEADCGAGRVSRGARCALGSWVRRVASAVAAAGRRGATHSATHNPTHSTRKARSVSRSFRERMCGSR